MALGKTVYVVFVVAILVVAAGAAVVVKNNSDDREENELKAYTNAVLKVSGNIDEDRDIDQDDVKIIERLIDEKASAVEYPLADANRDGKIDQKDVDIVNKIINGESTEIWHVSYHDVNGDGVMDEELVKTKFPVKSAIMTGSTNSFLLMTMCGIVEEIKGASYSSADKVLFGNTFLDTNKVTKLTGSSATEMDYEAGASGASQLVAEKNVTALITDWNQTYIPNYKDFEDAGVDVVRVAAASTDKKVCDHSILLLGLLFQKVDRTKQLAALYDTVFDEIALKASAKPIKAIASSMNGYVSSESSDYFQVLKAAGASFGLDGYDFKGKTSVKVVDNIGIFDKDSYNFDYIIHIRTGVSYANYDAAKIWKSYTDAFALWNDTEHQYIISGTVPVPVRIALAASIINDDISEDWANEIHQKFLDSFLQKYNYETHTFESYGFDLSKMSFLVHQPETS